MLENSQNLFLFLFYKNRCRIAFAVILTAAAVVRFGLLATASGSFVRLDTPGYFEPFTRAPGLRWFSFLTGFGYLPLALTFVSLLTVVLVYCAAECWSCSRNAALAAMFFSAFNLTAIANAPLVLSDTLFGFFAAAVFWEFGKFYRFCRVRNFIFAMLSAGIGTLIRPIGLLWFIPASVAVLLMPHCDFRLRIKAFVSGNAVFALTVLPLMLFNAAHGAGFCIDTNTGAVYHQNGAMLLAEINQSSYEEEKHRIDAGLAEEFRNREKYPDAASRERYRKKMFVKLAAAHPAIWLKQQLNWKILIPDAPSYLELLGKTAGDRGTMDVMQRYGVWAGVKHYFAPYGYGDIPWYAVCCTGIMYVFAAFTLLLWIYEWRGKWYFLLLFLVFAEYYLFLPGAISAPRYVIPALPFLAAMAGLCYSRLLAYRPVAVDLGNVCVKLDFRDCFRRLGITDAASLPPDILSVLDCCERGLLTDGEMLRYIAGKYGVSRTEAGEIFGSIISAPVAGMRETLSGCRRFGLVPRMFSDTGAFHLRAVLKSAPFLHRYADGVYSFSAGAKKPEAKMFEAFELAYGKPVLYVDDRPDLIAAARSRGWTAELFVSADELHCLLSKIRRSF